MIVRSAHFDVRSPHWMNDPNLPDEARKELAARGLADPANQVECLNIEDDCFKCGEKLTTPYIYWNGANGSLSLHADCAAKLALGLVQDAHALQSGSPTTEVEASAWLAVFAQKKSYGVEGE